MITTKGFLTEHCEQNSQPAPTNKDLVDFGKVVSREWRYWVATQSDDILAAAGWTRLVEGGRTLIVAHYPKEFKIKMTVLAFGYFIDKSKQKEPKQHPSKRKRIPTKQPTFSAKPSK